MNLPILVDELEILTNAPNGISLLRTLILDLALSGKLSAERMEFEPKLLGDIAAIKTGKLDANASSEDGIYPFFTCAKDPLRISTFTYETECVLLAGNGNFDVNYYSGKFDAYQRTYILEPKSKEELFVPFLFRFMQSHARKLKEQSIGGVIKYLKIGFLTSAPIQLPSFKNQQSIVAIIDSLMSMCDEIEARISRRDSIRTSVRSSAIDAISTAQTSEELQIAWERIQNNWEVIAGTVDSIESIRTLILDLAVRGQIAPHDQSGVSAEELIAESIQIANRKKTKQAVNNQGTLFEIPKHWVWSAIEDLCETQTGTTPKIQDSDNFQELIHYVTAADMVKLKAVKNRSVPMSAAKRGGRIAPKNSVLFVGIGATIGKCCLISSPATFNQQIHAATPRNINAQYLCLILASGYFQKICRERTNATAIPILNKSKWETINIPVPPLNEQKKIAETVSELFNLCDELESLLTIKSSIAEKFSRSVVSASA